MRGEPYMPFDAENIFPRFAASSAACAPCCRLRATRGSWLGFSPSNLHWRKQTPDRYLKRAKRTSRPLRIANEDSSAQVSEPDRAI